MLFITSSPALLALSPHVHLPEPVFTSIRGKLSAIIIYLMLEHAKRFHFFHFSTMWPYRRGMQPPILIAETPLRRDFKERQKLGKQTMVMKENVLKSFYIKRDRQPFLAHTPSNG
ncbi:hypothetical protein CR164_00915 [Prosthecochloris marina]|uniref:Uncharacterized protein n=1 Tax=Prosthecochloris marina TaxID=2017681 RepID=A0A317T8Y5_9CHLB|nr:hypothetical protein [Prosthecochloris marina]PWW83152.1 hypothetical protein CR164_00915 [Prosthecochloris marina]